MNDLIRRQDAIDVKAEFLNEYVIRDTEAQTLADRAYAKGWNECSRHWIDAIKELPSSQPEVLAHGEGESTSNGIMLMIGDDGIFREYSDEFDIVIHCENKDDQNEIIKMMTEGSGPFHFIPEGGR